MRRKMLFFCSPHSLRWEFLLTFIILCTIWPSWRWVQVSISRGVSRVSSITRSRILWYFAQLLLCEVRWNVAWRFMRDYLRLRWFCFVRSLPLPLRSAIFCLEQLLQSVSMKYIITIPEIQQTKYFSAFTSARRVFWSSNSSSKRRFFWRISSIAVSLSLSRTLALSSSILSFSLIKSWRFS